MLYSYDISMLFPAGTNLTTMDRTYHTPARAWLYNTLLPRYRAIKREAKLEPWRKTNDCNRHAMLLKVVADALYDEAEQSNPLAAENVAVGVLVYQSRKSGWLWTGARILGLHAINFAVVMDGDKQQLVFLEPQATGGVVESHDIRLASDEAASIMWAYI